MMEIDFEVTREKCPPTLKDVRINCCFFHLFKLGGLAGVPNPYLEVRAGTLTDPEKKFFNLYNI